MFSKSLMDKLSARRTSKDDIFKVTDGLDNADKFVSHGYTSTQSNGLSLYLFVTTAWI